MSSSAQAVTEVTLGRGSALGLGLSTPEHGSLSLLSAAFS